MDGVVDESDNSITTASDRVIATDGEIACELLESGVHAEFDLLHIGDQHLVTVMEVQQLSVLVPNAIAVELQKPAYFKGRSWSGSARLGR